MTSNVELGLFLFAIALVLAATAWRMLITDRENVRLAAASSTWPTAIGHVQSSEVVKHVATRRDSETDQDIEQITYEPTVSYVYAIGGTELAGSRLSFKRAHYISDKKANAAVARFPKGATVDVAYDPADPRNSVLDRETKPSAVSLWTAMLMISTAAAAVFGIVMLTAAG